MGWLERLGLVDSPGDGSGEREEETPEEPAAAGTAERPAPAVAALLSGVDPEGDHAVLDLGPASDSSLQVYGRFARRVRFADLMAARSLQGLPAALDAIPAQPDRPYDLVFVWDVLDRLFPPERTRLMERLEEITASGARLHAVFRSSEDSTAPPRRFALLGEERMRCEVTGPPRPARARLLPMEVEELLAPFQVMKGFTLRGELREYYAVRRD